MPAGEWRGGGTEGRSAGKAAAPPAAILLPIVPEEIMCEHSGCHCQKASVERNGKKYCSETCAEVQTSGKHGGHCPCGHLSCGVS